MFKSKIQNPKSKINPKLKCQIIKDRFYTLSFVACVLPVIILTSGCETIKKGTKGFLGVSTRSLEEARKDAVIKTFNYDYFTCYTKALDILKSMNTYAYEQNIKKHMIAIYVSAWDTTPVGLFFKEIDANNTQIEVSSLSTYAKEFISNSVFSVLDKKMTLEELEAKINAQETPETKEAKEKAREAGQSHR